MPDDPFRSLREENQRIRYYRRRPAHWLVHYLGFRPESLWWSLNDGYEERKQNIRAWDSAVQMPGSDKWHPCPNPLVAFLNAWASGYQQVALQSASNVGKAQPLDEPVQTPRGPRPMGEIQPGDKVIGSDGTPTEVLSTHLQGERSVYKVEMKDGTHTYADGQHLWSVTTTSTRTNGRPPQVYTTTQLAHKMDEVQRGYWLPIPEPVQYPEKDFPIDPYVLGALLGDGNMIHSLTFSTGDEFILQELENRTREKVELNHYSDYDYGVKDNKRTKLNRLEDELDRYNLMGKKSENKFIPDEYFYGSVEQRLLLLKGLMDTDGCLVSQHKGYQFNSSSEDLIDGVRQIVWSLGGSATKRRKTTAYDHLGSYATAIRLPNRFNPFRLPRKADKVVDRGKKGQPKRKIESIEFDRIDKTKCIRVAAEDSLYLTRDYIVTHNTFLMAGAVLHYLDTHRPSLVKSFAPTEDTLEDQLFGYMGEMLHGLNDAPGFKGLHPQSDKHNDLNLYMNPESDARDRWKASGDPVEAYSGEQADTGAESAAGAQGAHAEWMTLIIEEATGVDMSIWNALDITLSQKNQLIAYGNPDSENDPLNKFAERPSTLVFRISGLDHPNYVCQREVIPGAFNPNQPERMEEKFGSRDHGMWKSRVRGICPRTSGECLFKEKALTAVEEHHRIGSQEDGRLSELPWRDPVFEIPHTPDRWRPALLKLAKNESAKEEGEMSVAEKAEEEAMGIYDIEGHTKIFEVPKFDMIGRYVMGLDVAGDYSGGDAHAGHLYDRIERHVVAEIHLRGPREAYALQALALARAFRVPYVKDKELIEAFEKSPRAEMTERYLGAERAFRKHPGEIQWPGRDQSYPKLAWETNGVGALHKIGTFKAYPNKYYDKSPDIQGAKRSRRMGWQTKKGKTGTRKEMIENLRDWHHLLAYDPEAVPSELLLGEMKTFKKDKSKDRYEAETGEHDDHVMAQGICLTVSDRMADPTEAKTPSPNQKRTKRAQIPEETEPPSMWENAGQSDLWSM